MRIQSSCQSLTVLYHFRHRRIPTYSQVPDCTFGWSDKNDRYLLSNLTSPNGGRIYVELSKTSRPGTGDVGKSYTASTIRMFTQWILSGPSRKRSPIPVIIYHHRPTIPPQLPTEFLSYRGVFCLPNKGIIIAETYNISISYLHLIIRLCIDTRDSFHWVFFFCIFLSLTRKGLFFLGSALAVPSRLMHLI